jgi:hypothetical protein
MRKDLLRTNAVVMLTLMLLLGTGCASDRVLLANFNNDSVGAVPATNQAVGSVFVDQGAGSVRVAAPPAGASTNWVEIRHPNANSPQTGLQGKFAQFRGEGKYGFLGAVFIPTNCGTVTLQFEPAQNGPSDLANFLHLDFLPNNRVRINDTDTVFGQFPRDQFFTVSVTLNILPGAVTADLTLFGTGASGSHTHTVGPPLAGMARNIGGIRWWMGFQHAGAFKVDDIVVSYTRP